MQPGPNSDDINTILSRFHTWAEKQPADGNGNGHKNGAGSGELREMSYGEAILEHRNRRAAQTSRRTRNAAAGKSAAKAVTPAQDRTAPPEAAADRIGNLPVVSDAESVDAPAIADAPRLSAAAESAPTQPAPALEESSDGSDAPRKAPPWKRVAGPQKGKTEAPKQESKIIAVAPEVSAVVAEPSTVTPAPRAARAARKVLSKTAPAQIAVSASGKAALKSVVARVITARPAAKALKTAAKSGSAAPAKVAAKSVAQRAVLSPRAAKKTAASSSAATKKSKARRPPFRQVLAKSVQQPKGKPAPDRTRRITTRFSPAEERRIEKQAADLGINVSAYLRQCALAASAQNALAPAIAATISNKKSRKSTADVPAESRLYYAPSGSFLGGWLALLRNRFLGPPARFSEEA
ncbi:MAG TPA: hypothetical protein VHZ25_04550 [Acidobacteriaceae bacterium]|nr:hypothetical protein [Acidobacteriaceae bacterium]